jgi:membrane protease YdiL (CAAX protease family)
MMSPGLRRRAALELGSLVVLSALFLTLVPRRPLCLDMALALGALGLVGLSARETRERFWGGPALAWHRRFRRSMGVMLALSLPAVLAFAVYGSRGRTFPDALQLLFHPAVAGTFVVFVPWALVQQTLFQFYLLGRLRQLLAVRAAIVLAGLGYGAVHLPDGELALLTSAAGIVWSWAYERDRVLLPLALSHALLGTTYFAWVHGRTIGLSLLPNG